MTEFVITGGTPVMDEDYGILGVLFGGLGFAALAFVAGAALSRWFAW